MTGRATMWAALALASSVLLGLIGTAAAQVRLTPSPAPATAAAPPADETTEALIILLEDDAAHGMLPAAHNFTEWSVMRYRPYIGGPLSYTNVAGSGNQTCMASDIAALQYIYGGNFTANAGNTAYSWNASTGEMAIDGVGQGASATNTVYGAVWDGGGTDTYDLSGYTTAVTVSLVPGAWSTLAQGQLAYLSGGNLTIRAQGNVSNAFLYGNDPRSLIENATGGSGNDSLTGNTAANVLDGGAGSDTMAGGTGNDTYVVDSGTDLIVEAVNSGTDVVRAAVSFTLGANVENLILLSGSINGTGNALANTITGTSGDNVLNGGAGADRLVGGDGNDTYVVDSAGDTVVENASEGTDTVISAITYKLLANIENLTLSGTAAINGTGNTLDNTITGNSGVNVLDGGAGNDTLLGGSGNDTYRVDSTGDVVTEASGGGTDLVLAAVSYVLGTNVENLTLSGTASIDATGNGLANVITGNTGANLIDGGAGADTMVGGAGNDTYLIDATGDLVTEGAGLGTDTVIGGLTYTLTANVESLVLTGSASLNGTGNVLANTITGNSGDNVLIGGAGADMLIGDTGNDTYIVDAAGDSVLEAGGAGIDWVQSSVSHTLTANVENLTLTGALAINGTGNSLDNTITGNAGNNVLDGSDGADTMVFGAGNDTYRVDSASDVVTEAANAGTDTVQSAISYALGANVENLTLTGTGDIGATGNAVANTLTGNSGADILNGGAGRDVLIAGGGADRFDFTSLSDSAAGTMRDLIQDFSHAQGDTIYLTALDANSSVAGDQDFSFIGNQAFGHAAAQLRYAAGVLAGDVNGDGTADFEIGMTGAPVLVAGDFLL